jgi:predicted NodU family carbamoyl transferase
MTTTTFTIGLLEEQVEKYFKVALLECFVTAIRALYSEEQAAFIYGITFVEVVQQRQQILAPSLGRFQRQLHYWQQSSSSLLSFNHEGDNIVDSYGDLLVQAVATAVCNSLPMRTGPFVPTVLH